MITTIFQQYTTPFLIGVGIFFLLALLELIRLNHRIYKIDQRYKRLTKGTKDASWDDLLEHYREQIDQLEVQSRDAAEKLSLLSERQNHTFNRISIVHYDAFDHIYGHLSFSLAILNDEKNGYIFSNIHGREDARCYCKEIRNGISENILSVEEKTVLENALNQR